MLVYKQAVPLLNRPGFIKFGQPRKTTLILASCMLPIFNFKVHKSVLCNLYMLPSVQKENKMKYFCTKFFGENQLHGKNWIFGRGHILQIAWGGYISKWIGFRERNIEMKAPKPVQVSWKGFIKYIKTNIKAIQLKWIQGSLYIWSRRIKWNHHSNIVNLRVEKRTRCP